MIPLFSSLPRSKKSTSDSEPDTEEAEVNKTRRKIQELPAGRFASVSYVRIYSNCRIRRIWFVSDFDVVAGQAESCSPLKGRRHFRGWGEAWMKNGDYTLRNLCEQSTRMNRDVCDMVHCSPAVNVWAKYSEGSTLQSTQSVRNVIFFHWYYDFIRESHCISIAQSLISIHKSTARLLLRSNG